MKESSCVPTARQVFPADKYFIVYKTLALGAFVLRQPINDQIIESENRC